MEKGKGTAVEEVLKNQVFQFFSLTSERTSNIALSYQVTDGLVSLTFERDQVVSIV